VNTLHKGDDDDDDDDETGPDGLSQNVGTELPIYAA
jgi:hypothetical protein